MFAEELFAGDKPLSRIGNYVSPQGVAGHWTAVFESPSWATLESAIRNRPLGHVTGYRVKEHRALGIISELETHWNKTETP